MLISAMSLGHSAIISPLFRNDVARLSGVLLGVVFWLLECWSILCSCSRSGPAQAVAGEIEAMGIVDEAVEDSVGIGRIADDLMPFSASENGVLRREGPRI